MTRPQQTIGGKNGVPNGTVVSNGKTQFIAKGNQWVEVPSSHGDSPTLKSLELDRRQELLDPTLDDSLVKVKEKISEAKRISQLNAAQLEEKYKQKKAIEEAKTDLDHLSKQEFTEHYLNEVFRSETETEKTAKRLILDRFNLDYVDLRLDETESSNAEIRSKYVNLYTKLVETKYKSLDLSPQFSLENASQKEINLVGKLIFHLTRSFLEHRESVYTSFNELLDEAKRELKANKRYSQLLLWALHYVTATQKSGRNVTLKPFPQTVETVRQAGQGALNVVRQAVETATRTAEGVANQGLNAAERLVGTPENRLQQRLQQLENIKTK
jgi:hypothetical protein